MRGLGIGLAAAALVAAGPAAAAVVTFEPEAGLNVASPTTFSEAGFDFLYTPTGGGFAQVAAPASCSPACASNGTNAFYSFNSGTLTITKTGGGLFNAYALDAAQTFTMDNRALDLLLTGAGPGGPSSLTLTTVPGGADSFTGFAFVGSFNNLTSLTLSGVPPYPGVEFAVDNIVLDAVSSVPEPGQWAMLIGGFALAGGALRRRGRRAAAIA